MDFPGVYILQSIKNGRYYIGSTNDVERRIQEHNEGLVDATKYIKPLRLKVFIKCVSLQSARMAEYRLKRYKSKKVVEKVIGSGILPWNYNKGV